MNSTDTHDRSDGAPAGPLSLPLEALPMAVPPESSPCPSEDELIAYASSPRRHADRRMIAAHVQQCTECALIAGNVAKLRQDARKEIGRAGALAYLRGEHPNPRRFEDHVTHCLGSRAWLGALRPFFFPALRSPVPAWATSAALCVALIVSVSTRPRPVKQPKDVVVPPPAQLDARAVAGYLEQFSRPKPSKAETQELQSLTNLLESRLYSDPALERDPSYLLLVGALFQRRHELTGEQRALTKSNELVSRAQRLLATRPAASHSPSVPAGGEQTR